MCDKDDLDEVKWQTYHDLRVCVYTIVQKNIYYVNFDIYKKIYQTILDQ